MACFVPRLCPRRHLNHELTHLDKIDQSVLEQRRQHPPHHNLETRRPREQPLKPPLQGKIKRVGGEDCFLFVGPGLNGLPEARTVNLSAILRSEPFSDVFAMAASTFDERSAVTYETESGAAAL